MILALKEELRLSVNAHLRGGEAIFSGEKVDFQGGAVPFQHQFTLTLPI
jgi:hypothetical protein